MSFPKILGRLKKFKENGRWGLEQTHTSRTILGGFGTQETSISLLVVIRDNCPSELQTEGAQETELDLNLGTMELLLM